MNMAQNNPYQHARFPPVSKRLRRREQQSVGGEKQSAGDELINENTNLYPNGPPLGPSRGERQPIGRRYPRDEGIGEDNNVEPASRAGVSNQRPPNDETGAASSRPSAGIRVSGANEALAPIAVASNDPSGLNAAKRCREPARLVPRRTAQSLWVTREEELLLDLTGRNRDPRGQIKWEGVLNAWRDASLVEPEINGTRNKGSLAAKLRSMTKTNAGDAGNRAEETVIIEPDLDIAPAAVNEAAGDPVVDDTAGGDAGVGTQGGNAPNPVAVERGDVPVIGPEAIQEAAGGGPPDGDPEIGEPGETANVVDEKFRLMFHRFYRSAFKSMERKPLFKPKKRIPDTLFAWVDDLIRGICAKVNPSPKVNLRKLNAAVYAAGQSINWWLTEAEKEYREKVNDWSKEIGVRIKLLQQSISLVEDTISWRRAGRKPTKQQRNNIALIKRRYRISVRTCHLVRLLAKLKSKVLVYRHQKSVREAELERKKLRKLPPKRAVEPKLEDSNIPVEEVQGFWAGIIGEPKPFRATEPYLEWARKISDRHVELPDLDDTEERALYAEVLKKARPFKAPGPDGIPNFYWKSIPYAKETLFNWIVQTKRRRNPSFPEWLTTGRIVLLYKGGGEDDPGNYRPISCLNTCYKMFTGMLARWILRQVEAVDVLPSSQLAIGKGKWGCTHAQMLDRMIIKDATSGKKRNIHLAWVDFRKAFDSVSHKGVMWVLKQIGVPEAIRKLVKLLMNQWIVRYEGRSGGKMTKSSKLKVRCGVLQGDTLSPLLFCLILCALSYWLDNHTEGYTTSSRIAGDASLRSGRTFTHLLYMDDLKLYAPSHAQLGIAIDGVEDIAGSIGLVSNRAKCAHVAHNLTAEEAGGQLEGIGTLGASESYKYLGMDQRLMLDKEKLRERLREKVLGRVSSIWKTNLTFGQMVENTNSMVNSAARFMFTNTVIGSGKFSEETKFASDLDSEIRGILTDNKARFKLMNVQRLYIGREKGGVGLKPLVYELVDGIVYALSYAALTDDLKLTWYLCKKLENSNKRSLISDFNKALSWGLYGPSGILGRIRIDTDVPCIWVDEVAYTAPTQAARAICRELKRIRDDALFAQWRDSDYTGKFLRDAGLDIPRSLRWLSKGLLNKVATRNVMAVQDGQLFTKTNPSYTGENGVCTKTCRMKCWDANTPAFMRLETIQHVVSSCPHWRSRIKKETHDSVGRNIIYEFCRKHQLPNVHYTRKMPSVIENAGYSVWWDLPIHVRTEMRCNRPDIVIFDHERKLIRIVEVRVSWYSSIGEEEKRKFQKYGVNSTLKEDHPLDYPAGPNLASELEILHSGYSVKVIPIVVGCCGEVSKNALAYMLEIGFTVAESESIIDRMSRSAALGTHRLIKAHLANPAEPSGR